MIGALGLAIAHARANWGRSLVLCVCLGVVIGLPLVTRVIVADFGAAMRSRAATVPLVVGAKGSRFDLVFNALHFRASDLGPLSTGAFAEIDGEDGVFGVPIHARYTARGAPVVGSSFDYVELRGLRVREGRMLAALGEALIGSRASARLGVGAGGEIPTDQVRSYDITAPPSLMLSVVGVLEPTGTPDDDAVFVDLETSWVIEGIAHGHEAAAAVIDPGKLIGRSEEHVALSGAVVEYQRITDENVASFHIHGERDDLPLSAALLFPDSDKTRTIVAERINATPDLQAVEPAVVIDDLIAFVVRLRTLIDAVAVALGAVTLALLGLIAILSYRARMEEMATLREIGASVGVVRGVFWMEFGLLLAGGIVLASIGAAMAMSFGDALYGFVL